jgi:cell division protein FtsI (penicillin-binding protein 3)
MSNKKSITTRVHVVYFGFVILMVLGIYKTILIQQEGSASFFSATKDKIPTRSVKRFPRRGEILDRNYTPLQTSVSFFDIHMDPMVVKQETFDKEISNLCVGLHKIFPETSARDFENYIRNGRARKRRYLTIKRRATIEQRRLLKELPIFNLGQNKGGLIDNDETLQRKRPHGEMLKRTLGYCQNIGEDNELRVGIEGAYNELLAGEPGEEIEQKISSGWKKTGKMVKNPIEGADLVTTFDIDIQEVAHSELLRQLREQGAKSGCVIVMDVKTGFVRAVANLQKGTDGQYYELYNHAVGTKEVPGSTFKLASIMAALEDKKIRLSDKVNAKGEYEFYGKKFHDSNEWGYGEITIQRAFEVSSNVITQVIQRAYRNDPQVFVDRLKSFGLADPLGVDIKGEPIPTMYQPGHRNWSGLSLPSMAIGYEFQQTPLQTLAFYNAVANDGVLVRPQFIEEVRRNGQLVSRTKPVVLKKQICSMSTVRAMQNCLEGVVKYGTGKPLQSSLFDIAGKTGTARILNDQNQYGEEGFERYQASFVGYFPSKEPIYSCIVVISAPSKDIYGATVSGTVFSAIANKVYSNTLKYHKAINEQKRKDHSLPQAYNGNTNDLLNVLKYLNVPQRIESYSDWSAIAKNGNVLQLYPRKYGKEVVPNVVGMTARDAVYLIERLGMHVILRGYGKVVEQTIPAGKQAFPGGMIELKLK